MRAKNVSCFGLVLVSVLISSTGCSSRQKEAQTEPNGASPNRTVDRAAGVQWTAPERWAREADRPMRAATYRIPTGQGDPEDAECGVSYFGAGEGGSVEANLSRWVGQFEQLDGKPSEQAAQKGHRTINGLGVHTISLAGTYLASAGPMSPVKEKKPGLRLLGAIVEAPQGSVFFKLTGPARTVAAAEQEFNAMLESLKRE